MLPPPLLTSLDIGITATPVNPQQIFPVMVEIEMARVLDLLHADFLAAQSVYLAQTLIAPKTKNDQDNDPLHSLSSYAQAFEDTFGGFIKAATGQRTATLGQEVSRQIWAVDFRPGALSFDIQGNDTPDQYGNNPDVRYFALKPLANTLVSASEIEISPYVSGQGLVQAKAEKRTFQAIDMDVWAREFLSAVEIALSPEYAASIYNLPGDGNADDHDGAYHYRRMMMYKGELVASIKQGLQLVFAESGGDLQDAQEALAQRLLISLSNAYEIDTVVQLPVKTTSYNMDRKTAPRISGKPVATTTNSQTSPGGAIIQSLYC